MRLLHLSSKGNRDSILKNGLLPSKISLDQHKLIFQDNGLIGDKCVYTWDADKGQSTDKYIRDMIYCKLFIHPRNKMSRERDKLNRDLYLEGKIGDNEWDDNDIWIDFEKLGTKLYGESSIYDLFEIDIDEEDPLLLQTDWHHGQMKCDDKTSTTFMMNDDYAHDDKVLHIGNSIIPPEKLKLVTSIKSRIYRNDTIGLTYSKNL